MRESSKGAFPAVTEVYKHGVLPVGVEYLSQDVFGKSHEVAKVSGSLKIKMLVPFLPLNGTTVN